MNDNELIELQKKLNELIYTKNKIELLTEIDNIGKILDKNNCNKLYLELNYLVGTCYLALNQIDLNENENAFLFEQEYLFKSIFHLRKIISTEQFDKSDTQTKLKILVNLANSFSSYGRFIEALRYYEKAIFEVKKEKIFLENSSFSENNIIMLYRISNCLYKYANNIYEPKHRFLYFKKSYEYYKECLNQTIYLIEYCKKNKLVIIDDINDIKNNCSQIINDFEKQIGEKQLNLEIKDDYELPKNKNHQKYIKWCLENKFYINPMNDIRTYNTDAHDIMSLPNLRTKIKIGFPIEITYFNQIKQEYIFNRVLLYKGISRLSDNFFDKDKALIDDFDYNLYDIHIENIKSSLKGFYSIFDKISYLLNEYLKLGFDENRIDFNKIWRNKNNKGTFNPNILSLKNNVIKGLYLLSRDINFDKEENEFNLSIEPDLKDIAKIRNHLEHKFCMIKVLKIDENNNERTRKYYSLTEDELIEKTMRLCSLIREAIIYVSMIIYEEELCRNEKCNEFAAPIQTEFYKNN